MSKQEGLTMTNTSTTTVGHGAAGAATRKFRYIEFSATGLLKDVLYFRVPTARSELAVTSKLWVAAQVYRCSFAKWISPLTINKLVEKDSISIVDWSDRNSVVDKSFWDEQAWGNEVGLVDPAGDHAQHGPQQDCSVSLRTNAALLNESVAGKDRMAEEAYRQYSEDLWFFEDAIGMALDLTDIQQDFEHLVYCTEDNPYGQNVFADADEMLKGSKWQVSDDEQPIRIVERNVRRIALNDMLKPLLEDLMYRGTVDPWGNGETDEIEGYEAFQVRDFQYRRTDQNEPVVGVFHVLIAHKWGRSGQAGVCSESGDWTWWCDANSIEDVRKAWSAEEIRIRALSKGAA
jgi:hypothetical protein